MTLHPVFTEFVGIDFSLADVQQTLFSFFFIVRLKLICRHPHVDIIDTFRHFVHCEVDAFRKDGTV